MKELLRKYYEQEKAKFSKEMIDDTKKYQKKYGFDSGSNNSTHNNEADAFKHTYMQALLTINRGVYIAKFLGDQHEKEGNNRNQPAGEANMDLWNNQQGREIAEELKKEFGSSLKKFFTDEGIKDIIADRVVKRMKNGQLITSPDDKRKFQENKSNNITGQATNIEDLERIFTAEEIGDMSNEEYLLFEKYIDNQLKTFGIPRKSQADEEVKSGNLIWVNTYTRSDGTEVSGYYRHK